MWAEHLGEQAQLVVETGGFCWFELDGVEIGFHPADDVRNPIGASPVVYWTSDNVEAQRSRLVDAGCRPHRGPLVVEPDRRICQPMDPFGNVFGLDGP